MPEISIIIPVYNAQRTLEKCLASIFAQTFSDYEIIAVNDGSIDGSRKILDSYKDRIKIIDQTNQGAAVARNVGAKIATAPFIIFCDADIVMWPAMLQIMYDVLQKNLDVSYVYSSFIFGQKTFNLWPFDRAKLKQMPFIHTTSLMRREHFPGFDESLKRFQDWDLWLTMLARGFTGYFIPQVLFQVASGGTMSSWLPKFMYNFSFLPSVKRYQAAEKIIRKKHNL